MNGTFSWEAYARRPVIAILRGLPSSTIMKIAEAYTRAEFINLEVTMNTDDAPSIITTLKKEFPNLNIGAGTVCTTDDLNIAIDAGSEFIVTPITDPKVIHESVSQNIPIFSGAYSPTEIHQAWTLGASAVKVFPANQLGPAYIKDVLAPLNTLKLIPTGGVTLQNIKSFFEAGAFGVGMGSGLLDKGMIQAHDFEGLQEHFLKIKNQLQAFI